MKRILVGVCSSRNDKRFWDSFFNFMNECSGRYDIAAMIIKDTFLPDAQNAIAKCFIGANYDYLLFLDDDHWGHTVEMLDCLVEADYFVATMKTYTRHYPYVCAAWNRLENGFLLPIEKGDGYVKCDLTGFPMTLIRKDVFDLLDEPYFRKYVDGERDWNSDVDFFNRLAEFKIKPIVCFQFCLNHDKITQNNVFEYRAKEIAENNNIAWYKVLEDIAAGRFKTNQNNQDQSVTTEVS